MTAGLWSQRPVTSLLHCFPGLTGPAHVLFSAYADSKAHGYTVIAYKNKNEYLKEENGENIRAESKSRHNGGEFKTDLNVVTNITALLDTSKCAACLRHVLTAVTKSPTRSNLTHSSEVQAIMVGRPGNKS